ncbi:hypothetical protein [Hyphomonas sp. CY54-11-8]|jgi:hypothetical protein|uniref:hypothetical protein n=1 Tax=Hyphomonas sp. CY54-11-8 TaxID=1280944 RepID=UPI000458EA26|nr:hypothetical protein [Hyphomonas sp. CY54-11-8]KCZ47735.1 hypothetical protein HY17_04465 [Hyphomonas sp. CY54-11-8]
MDPRPAFKGYIEKRGGRIEVNVTLCSRSDIAEFVKWLNAFEMLLPEETPPNGDDDNG